MEDDNNDCDINVMSVHTIIGNSITVISVFLEVSQLNLNMTLKCWKISCIHLRVII